LKDSFNDGPRNFYLIVFHMVNYKVNRQRDAYTGAAIAFEPYKKYDGHSENPSENTLRRELVAVVDKYFSVGILSFYYDI
jgi:hypothetical protein